MNASLTCLAALAMAACLSSDVAAQDEGSGSMNASRMHRTISVTGTGKVSAAPDVADINIGVVTQGDAAAKALAANTEAMTAIQTLLKERGVAEKDVQTTGIDVQPVYSQQQRQPQQQADYTPRIVGYRVTNSVRITARDLKKLGAILDAVVQSGANQINGISFRIENPEKLLDVARKQAMADAKRKAEQLAGESGVIVGLPISIQESGGMPIPMPKFGGMRMAMAADAAPVPVAAGELDLSVSVSVVYDLKPAN